MNPSRTAPPPSFCLAAFRLWLAGGLLALVIPGAFGASTPVGPLAAWLVAMPLACLVALEPCRACVAVLRVATVRMRVRPQARRLRRSAA
ncbi:MAG TPA: hypothetical protein VFO79_11250 [Xanthomonadales bacterium]|nr:hypothetical protein [Xanthomonadales bacterium]